MVRPVQYRRLLSLALLLGIAFVGLAFRLVHVQIVQHEKLRAVSERNTQRTFLREPLRGEIRDRNGRLLAGSVFVKTVCADPSLIGMHQKEVAKALAPLLQMPEEVLEEKLQIRTFVDSSGQPKIDRYVVLKRKVLKETWHRIQERMKELTFGIDEEKLPWKERMFYKTLREKAIFTPTHDDQLRVYPNRTLASHVIGFVGEGQVETFLHPVARPDGKEGIEAWLDPILSGVHGWRKTEVAKARELVQFRHQDVDPHSGGHVVLTIDIGLQNIVEAELAELMEKHSPLGISAIAVRPQTGEILAMANLPTFDPNDLRRTTAESRRNRAITDTYEPGSTFKIVAIAGALNEGLVSLDSLFDCEGGRIMFAGRPLNDDHGAGILSVREIITQSSNIGTFKVAQKLGEERLYQYIRNFGFGSLTRVPLYGETAGLVRPVEKWYKISISRIPMGQGIAVTPLQMVMAMSAIANGGKLMRPMLIDRLLDADGQVVMQYRPEVVRRVISEKTAGLMVEALMNVVASTNGTAKKARLEHYSVAGKTGTAQKPMGGRYPPGKYFTSFVGFFPATDPELCMLIVLDEPKRGHYGGQIAAPAFRRIAERAAQYLAIRPDLHPADTLPESGVLRGLTVNAN